jgi:hypothetical protein
MSVTKPEALATRRRQVVALLPAIWLARSGLGAESDREGRGLRTRAGSVYHGVVCECLQAGGMLIKSEAEAALHANYMFRRFPLVILFLPIRHLLRDWRGQKP